MAFKVNRNNPNMRINELATAMGTYWKRINENKNIETNKMARQRTFKKNSTRSKKNRRRRIIKRAIPRTIQPASKLIKCRVSDYQTFTSASGVMGMLPINCCDITDPLGAFSTQQPLGYDQWKTLYRTAYVVGCKVKFTVYNNQSLAIVYGVAMMDKNQGTTSLANYEYYRETPKNVSRILSPDVDYGVLVNKQSTKRGLHIKDIVDNDTIRINLQSDTAPNETYYAHCYVQPLDQTSSFTGSVQAVIDVEYLVLLTNPVTPSRSTA